MSDSDPKREPFVSINALLFFGGAMLWAANQNWIEMAEFYRSIVEGWRDFLRAIWSRLFELLRVRITLLPHQTDMLSLNAILLGSAVHRQIFGDRLQPLIYPSFETVRFRFAERFKKFGFLAYLLPSVMMFVLTFALYVMILSPFLDTVRFSHDIQFTLLLSIFLFSAYQLKRMYGDSTQFAVRIWKLIKAKKIEELKAVALRVWPILAAIAIIVLASRALNWLFEQLGVRNFIAHVLEGRVDPQPFNIGAYFMTITGEAGVDLILIAASSLLLFLSSGKSLKPIAQFVCLGFAIAALGWVSGVVVDVY